jgi:hypothetical protein
LGYGSGVFYVYLCIDRGLLARNLQRVPVMMVHSPNV